MAYQDFNTDDLGVLRCSDPDCAGTKLPSSNLTTTNVGEYALPKTCFSVRDSIQTPLFTVCDNDFQGSPELDAACIPDGVCEDEDPAGGFISVTVVPATYNVVESTAAPEHTLDTSKEVCVAPASLTCTVSFSSAPKVRPWHPWDIVGGPGNTPDGVVRVQDILEVVNHYFDDKPLAP